MRRDNRREHTNVRAEGVNKRRYGILDKKENGWGKILEKRKNKRGGVQIRREKRRIEYRKRRDE